jgi:hypothetical protein
MANSSYYYSFYDHNFDRIFYARMYSDRCEFIKKNGERCKRRCCIGIEYCRSHVSLKLHLMIKQSNIPDAGLGLFAKKENANPNIIVFKKGQKICNYEGEILTDEEINERYRGLTAPYAVALNNHEFIDSALERGVASTANTLPNHNNASFAIDNRNKRASIRATRNIKQGEEILLSYGRSYKLPHIEGVSYQTRKYPTLH